MLRIKASGMEVAGAVGRFPIQPGSDMATANFHNGVQEMHLLGGAF